MDPDLRDYRRPAHLLDRHHYPDVGLMKWSKTADVMDDDVCLPGNRSRTAVM